jgi:hypothetical protein
MDRSVVDELRRIAKANGISIRAAGRIVFEEGLSQEHVTGLALRLAVPVNDMRKRKQ